MSTENSQSPATPASVTTQGVGCGAGFGVPPDAVAYGLKVGEQWGAYWLHADGMMRLYPPARTVWVCEAQTDNLNPVPGPLYARVEPLKRGKCGEHVEHTTYCFFDAKQFATAADCALWIVTDAPRIAGLVWVARAHDVESSPNGPSEPRDE